MTDPRTPAASAMKGAEEWANIWQDGIAHGAYEQTTEDHAAFIRTIQADAAAAERGKVPPGYRLVPEEPTQGMLNACAGWATAKGAYKAMIAAAPPVETGWRDKEGE